MERNRETYSQTMSDRAQLGSQIENLESNRAEADNITAKEMEFEQVLSTLRQEKAIYERINLTNTEDITVRDNDLAAMTFVLEMTKCKAGSSTQTTLAEIAKRKTHDGARVCSGTGGSGD